MMLSNPLLPSWEYVPDGEPHVFDGRLYLFGSHDRFGGDDYCLNDYVVWSTALDGLGEWTFHGVSYRKDQDPFNVDGAGALFAPDVAQGPDGRYYLYYCVANHPRIGVAVSGTPAGPYEFFGHVHDAAGNLVGSRTGDTEPFDPGVLVDNGRVWLYSGSGPHPNLKGSMDRSLASVVMELEPDMMTLRSEPRQLIPTLHDSSGTSFVGHEFFEASSPRRYDDLYYLVYASVLVEELCWAWSDRPDGGFEFGGTLITNGDVDSKTGRRRAYSGNNHGGLVKLGEQFAIFYHRHTNRAEFSRQACAELVTRDGEGRFLPARVTTSGLGGPLPAKGRFEARTACHLWSDAGAAWSNPADQDSRHPVITQSLPDRQTNPDQHIENLRNGATAGFGSFAFQGHGRIVVLFRGQARGMMRVRDGEDGPTVAELAVTPSSDWTEVEGELLVEAGIGSLYFTFIGEGAVDFCEFVLW